MVSGPGGRVYDSQNQYYLALETPGHSKQFKNKSQIIFDFFLDISKTWKSIVLNCLKRRALKSPDGPPNKFLKILKI